MTLKRAFQIVCSELPPQQIYISEVLEAHNLILQLLVESSHFKTLRDECLAATKESE